VADFLITETTKSRGYAAMKVWDWASDA